MIASSASNNITTIYLHPTLQEYPLDIISFYSFLSCLLWILNRTVLITILFSPSFCFWTHAAVRRTHLIRSYVWYIHYRYNNIILCLISFNSLFEQLLFTHAPHQSSSFSKQCIILSQGVITRARVDGVRCAPYIVCLPRAHCNTMQF